MAPALRPPILRSCTLHKFPPYQKTLPRVPPPLELARFLPSSPPPALNQNSVPCSPSPMPILPNYFFPVCAFPFFFSLTASFIPRVRARVSNPVARSFRFIAYSSCRLKKVLLSTRRGAYLRAGKEQTN